MNIGKLNQRIIFQSYAETRAANGGVIRNYTTFATRWAYVDMRGGNEGQQAEQKTARIPVDFHVRAGGLTINETMRIVWRGLTYDITSIQSEGQMLNQFYIIRGLAKDDNN